MNPTDTTAPRESGTGAGSATNSGIDYQQRVSAWFLATMVARTQLSPLLGISGDLVVSKISYENSDYVDDLRVATVQGKTLYLQIKRRVSLSKAKDSEWGKTASQFVHQHLAAVDSDDCLLLVTSPDSSARITSITRKFTDAIRLNPKKL